MWLCQFIDWLKFETRPSSRLNFGTAYLNGKLRIRFLKSPEIDFAVIARGQAKCVFPFDYKGTTYDSCTYANHWRPWCAWDRHYQKDQWSNCGKELI